MNQRIAVGLALGVLIAGSARLVVAEQRRERPRDREGRIVGAGDSMIAGRVVDASTNAPVRRAQVQGLSGDVFVEAITDEEGRFQLADLPAGEWRVTISKGGYCTWGIGQRRPFESPPAVTLAARQVLSADIPLYRCGVVTGRVYDETGEPLAGLHVRVYRARLAEGYRRLDAVGAADFTDDTGAYRIYGLPPGDYVVAASRRVAPLVSFLEGTYAPTYYPGTGDLTEAQRVRVALGSEATAIFALLPIRHVRVSGSVLTSAGLPADAFLSLTSEASELGAAPRIGGVTREDGTFTLPDVPPGKYTLGVSLRGDGESEVASLPLTVATEDVAGATLVTSRPAKLRARFDLDAGVSGTVPATLGVVAIAARPGGPVLSSSSGPAFELLNLAEPFYLRVDSLPEGWIVKTVVVNGLDVTDARISLPTGQEADARIVLTDRAAAVNGTVSADGRAAKADVIVFPEDRTKWTYPSRYVRVAATDAQGRFRVAGLPAAERYLAVATDYLEEGEHNDPGFLDRMREGASRFQPEEAETRVLDLVVIER
jgi:hypothetical protein